MQYRKFALRNPGTERRTPQIRSRKFLPSSDLNAAKTAGSDQKTIFTHNNEGYYRATTTSALGGGRDKRNMLIRGPVGRLGCAAVSATAVGTVALLNPLPLLSAHVVRSSERV